MGESGSSPVCGALATVGRGQGRRGPNVGSAAFTASVIMKMSLLQLFKYV